MAIIDLAYLKIQLGIDAGDTSNDTQLQQFIDQAEAIIKRYVKRPLEEATTIEYYNGNGRRQLVLKRRPVTSVTSVHEDQSGFFGDPSDSFDSSTELTEGEDFAIRRDNRFGDPTHSASGMLVRMGAVWPRVRLDRSYNIHSQLAHGLGNIRVEYTAGYSVATMPEDLKYAVATLVSIIRGAADQGFTYQSESLDYYSYNRGSSEDERQQIQDIKNVLGGYMEKVF